MRFLIVATAIFACAAAAPSGALLASPYSAGLIASPWAAQVAVASPVAIAPAPIAIAKTVAIPAAIPTIPPGDIQGAAIDNTVAAVDAVRAVNDQASELQGRAINAAEDAAWQSVSAVQTVQAQVDGAAAAVAPNVAKSLVAPVAVVSPVAAYAAAPAVYAPAVSPVAVAAAGPAILAARAIAAPAVIAGSQSISTQSLTQTHPSPIVASQIAYAAHGW